MLALLHHQQSQLSTLHGLAYVAVATIAVFELLMIERRSKKSQVSVASSGNALMLAARESDVERLQQLVGEGMPIDQRDKELVTPLMMACLHGNLDTVLNCIELGADVNAINKHGRSALFFVVYNENHPEDIVPIGQLLLDAGADTSIVDQQKVTALSHAEGEGQLQLLELLKQA